jgi:hypothetical protein
VHKILQHLQSSASNTALKADGADAPPFSSALATKMSTPLVRKIILIAMLLAVSILVIRYGKVAYEISLALSPENMCGVQLGAEALSPNQKLKAVIYQFDCGATSPFTTQVSILKPAEAIPYSAGNVFSAYKGSQKGAWRGPFAEIAWLSDTTLKVSYISDAVVQESEQKYRGINIKYVPLHPKPANIAVERDASPQSGSHPSPLR